MRSAQSRDAFLFLSHEYAFYGDRFIGVMRLAI